MTEKELWRFREMADGSGIGYLDSARPSISWKHIDGPMLCARDGQIHWLTLWERFRCWRGKDDAYSLERKRFPEIARDKLGYRARTGESK